MVCLCLDCFLPNKINWSLISARMRYKWSSSYTVCIVSKHSQQIVEGSHTNYLHPKNSKIYILQWRHIFELEKQQKELLDILLGDKVSGELAHLHDIKV